MKTKLTRLVSRFSFPRKPGIIRQIPLHTKGSLFVSPMPYGAYDTGNKLLGMYRQHRISHVFILVGDNEIKVKTGRDLKKIYEKAGMTFTQYPFVDMQAPNLPMMHEFVKTAVLLLKKNHNIAIHCHAGVGRTSIGACCVVQAVEGMSSADSIVYVKSHMEVNMTTEQKSVVMRFQSANQS
jgi:protein-tyrosine phosphatase